MFRPRVSPLLSFVAVLFALTVSATAQDSELGPAVGSEIPHQLNVAGQPGFSTLTSENGAAILFVRSINWCPYCKNQVINISAVAAEFQSRGVSLIFVSYDNAADQNRFQNQRELAGTFISDPNSEVIDAFGLRNEEYGDDHFAYGAPHPAIFFVDEGGIIRGKLYEADYVSNSRSYKNRPDTEAILAQADMLAGQ